MSDTISRQAAIEAVRKIIPIETEIDATLLDKAEVIVELSALPSAEAEPKTGKWVKIIDEETPNLTKWHYECDQCGAGRWEEGQRYCQNCGARMIREDGEA